MNNIEPGQIDCLIKILGENGKEEARGYRARLEEKEGKPWVTEMDRGTDILRVQAEWEEKKETSGGEALGEVGEIEDEIFPDATEGKGVGETRINREGDISFDSTEERESDINSREGGEGETEKKPCQRVVDYWIFRKPAP